MSKKFVAIALLLASLEFTVAAVIHLTPSKVSGVAVPQTPAQASPPCDVPAWCENRAL